MKKIIKKAGKAYGAVSFIMAMILLLYCVNINAADFGECCITGSASVYTDNCETGFTNELNGYGNVAILTASDISTETLSVSSDGRTTLYAGGIPFGVRFSTNGVMVVGFSEIRRQENPAVASGLQPADLITHIDGKKIDSVSDLTEKVRSCQGKAITLTYEREGKTHETKLTPFYCREEGQYKTGMCVRDSGAGIGTVTYIVPSSGGFGGLGHGICDAESGKLIPFSRGIVSGVTVNGVVRGVTGTPGELRGTFASGRTGTLIRNTECGVFGLYSEGYAHGELYETAKKSEVHEGEAYILCTLDDTGVNKYTISISRIDTSATGNKCFSVRITDERLKEVTGGIVQGMSGSPVIQDGRLIGAITHVLINDPTTGYGIFIDNMLGQMPDILK